MQETWTISVLACQSKMSPQSPASCTSGKACCQLSVNDCIGSPLPASTSLISCQLTASTGPQPADCTIMNTGPSTYEIKCSPVIHDSHDLRVMVGDVDIPGSVFSVPIISPCFETRSQGLHTIQGLEGPYCIAISGSGQVVVSDLVLTLSAYSAVNSNK